MKLYQLVIAAFLLTAQAGCGPSATSTPAAADSDAEQQSAGSPELVAPAPPFPAMTKIIAKVTEDLAQREQIDLGEIALITGLPVNWPDAGLGCPEPARSYAQVVTPGYMIVLEAGGEQFEYHTDSRAEVILLCAAGADSAYPVIPVAPGEIDDGEPWLPVE